MYFMKKIQMKTTSARLDPSTTDVCFGDSFTDDTDAIYLEDSSCAEMASNWIDIEDDIDILEEEVEETLEKLDSTDDAGVDGSEDEDMDMDEEVDMEEPAAVISKAEALNTIDLLKAYGKQDEAPESTMKYLHRCERVMMKRRMERATVHRSMKSYFANPQN